MLTFEAKQIWGFTNFLFFKNYLFIFGSVGSLLLAASRGYSSLQCVGFSLQWLLLLQSTGSRHKGSVVVVRGL